MISKATTLFSNQFFECLDDVCTVVGSRPGLGLVGG